MHKINAGRIRAAALLLLAVSQQLHALGLGDIEARSYLGQPLEARIYLISQSPDELGSVTAGMASVADFEMMGLTRVVSVPLHFDVNAEAAQPYIEVSSRLPVSDPVVQIVVEVEWAGGRMLREYTLFLDPPTIESKAPAPLVISGSRDRSAAAAGPARESYPPPSSIDVVETVKAPPAVIEDTPPAAQPEPEHVERDIPSEESAPETAVTGQAQADRPARETVTVPDEPILEHAADPATESESVVSEPGAEQLLEDSVSGREEPLGSEKEGDGYTPIEDLAEETATAPGSIEDSDPEAGTEVYGPVARGQTMWRIASNFAEGTTYSINQAMLAIQRVNPDAFGGNNINLLKTGAILRMPTFTEMEKMSRREAMVEAIRQENLYLAMRSGQSPAALPAIADTVERGQDAADGAEPGTPSMVAEAGLESGRLQLIPPADPAGDEGSGSGGGDRAVGALSSQELEEVLARTEEELANAQQENAYLNERIRELESQLAATGPEGGIEDTGLAEMEESLRDSRLNEAEEPPPETGEEEAWYRASAWWLGGLLLLLVAAVVWLLRRFSGRGGPGNEPGGDEAATVESIRTEAEDILKSLDDDSTTESSDGDNVIDLEIYVDPSESEQGEEDQAGPGRKRPYSDSLDVEAVELDADDPEVKLDLARAYISMGDAEAARQILEEVVELGDDEQVREARGMMKEISQAD